MNDRATRWIPNTALLMVVAAFATTFAGAAAAQAPQADSERRWLAGDHHIHSQFSMTLNRNFDPPRPALRSHGYYTIPHNALMAQHFGLDWMVSTDHGGREHSRINLEQAYPMLLLAREFVPDLIQYYGFELNPPGGPEHASVIVARTDSESEEIFSIESQFDISSWRGPPGPEASRVERMLEGFEAMREFPQPPVVIANHPSRPARQLAEGMDVPAVLRIWSDAAPGIAIGMEGAPGHQAGALLSPDYRDNAQPRGQYRGNLRTLGGFDPMTAELGGVWDSMLGEGRQWWITATSDSHLHWSEGGPDFWPGEYSKTYVYASKTYTDVLESLRSGRIFVTTGDLISELDFTASSEGETVSIAESMTVSDGADLEISIRVRDPAGTNHNGDAPSVSRIDLIAGTIDPSLIAAAGNVNPGTAVVRRFTANDWVRDGEYLSMNARLEDIDSSIYLRVRGTNTNEPEPLPDEIGENPWQDLWFYSNPIFVYSTTR